MTSRLVPAALACFTLCASLAVAQPQRRDPKEFWNQNHKEQRQLARTEPNDFMVRMLKDRKPGRALDIGMGQGRNAIWLAKQGWDVTGVDISDVGIAMAQEEAKKLGVTIKAIQKDIKDWEYGREQWDVVLLCYMQGDARFRSKEVIDSLKPGGVVIIETWQKELDADLGRAVNGFEVNEVFKLYGDIRIRHYEDVRAVPDWGRDLGGKPRPIVRIMAEKPAR